MSGRGRRRSGLCEGGRPAPAQRDLCLLCGDCRRGLYPAGMAFVALVVSVLALLAAGASAWYAREAARIDGQRRHAERTPTFLAEVQDVNGNGEFLRLWLTLASVEVMERITVELPDPCSFRFTSNVAGVADDRHASSYEGAVLPGGRVCWRVEPVGDLRLQGEKVLIRSTPELTLVAQMWGKVRVGRGQ